MTARLTFAWRFLSIYATSLWYGIGGPVKSISMAWETAYWMRYLEETGGSFCE